MRLGEELVQGEDLHVEIPFPVLVAHALAQSDRVEETRRGRARAVCRNGRLRHLPVFVHPLVVADVPHLGVRHLVVRSLVREGDELRLLLREEVLRRARIPVRHRAEILGHHQPAVERVLLEVAAQFAAVLQTPEERAVVVCLTGSREGLGGIWIGARLGESPLEEVVLPDAEHEHVQPPLQHPVDFLLPVFEAPVLRLETCEAAMREIAKAAILEVRLLLHVESGEVERALLRHHVAVPEPPAPAAPLQEVVDAVVNAPHIRTRDGNGGQRAARPTILLLSACCRHNPIRIPPRLRYLRIDGKAHQPIGHLLADDLPVVLCELGARLVKHPGPTHPRESRNSEGERHETDERRET